MQQITLSGTLISDASKFKDRNNKEFIKFIVTCGSTDAYGRTIFTHYRCICYVTGYEGMRKGDQVFLTGRFCPSLGTDESGKNYMNLDVMVISISGGYRASERKTDKRK